MQTICLSVVVHNDERRLQLSFEFNAGLNTIIRKIAESRWSKTLGNWHIPCTREAMTELAAAVALYAELDTAVLKEQLASPAPSENYVRSLAGTPKRGEFEVTADSIVTTPGERVLETSLHLSLIVSGEQKDKYLKDFYLPGALSEENRVAFTEYVTLLQLKAYSNSTIRTYKNEFGAFLMVLKLKSAASITPEELKRYMIYCTVTLKLGENSLHSRLNALKFYYEQVLKQEKFFYDIPRPKKAFQLPKVISEEKIAEGLLAIKNLKHKTLLLLAYSAGLRVSEVISLKITDINSDRMQININRAKGKKDRVVTLSRSILEILREYYKAYKPKEWLFEGQNSEEHYSARSAQLIFKAAYKDLNLPLQCSFHSLRHSFATHLLENGTDISYIQKILGHGDIKTTLRYARVSNKDIGKIESPLDKLMRKKGGR